MPTVLLVVLCANKFKKILNVTHQLKITISIKEHQYHTPTTHDK